MTTITIYNDKSGKHKGFDIRGHAGYAWQGRDIVCAAISMLASNTINSIEKYTDLNIKYDSDERRTRIRFVIKDRPNDESELLMNSMILGLSELEKNYKKYVTLKFEEV